MCALASGSDIASHLSYFLGIISFPNESILQQHQEAIFVDEHQKLQRKVYKEKIISEMEENSAVPR